MADRSGPRLSGRSSAVSVVLQAIIPQPMSTPTAAGMMALRVGITDRRSRDAEVHVGHRRDVLEDDRQTGRVGELAPGRVFDRHAACPHLDRHAAGTSS
jgi:hypothetical protein